MKKALIIVDVQNDFLPGGSLAVPDGDKIIPTINDLIVWGKYDKIVITQDWHPVGHCSFSKWPTHCVACTPGAELSKDLKRPNAYLSLRKGVNVNCDSHSAFIEEDGVTHTGLHDELKAHKIKKVEIVGLALDYCIRLTALDAIKLGYKTTVIINATKPVFKVDVPDVYNELSEKGCNLLTWVHIPNFGSKT